MRETKRKLYFIVENEGALHIYWYIIKYKHAIIYVITITIIIHTSVAINAAQTLIVPVIASEAAILIDGDTGQIIFDKNMHQRMYPASITKVMTALLALENGNLSDNITMSRQAVFSIGRNTSHIALDEGEIITLEQALYGIALESGNDASNGIAEHIGGSMDNFARKMTERATRAGALDTQFANAHGLPDESHYTTAYDMALVMMEAIKILEFIKIFSTVHYEIPPTNKNSETRHFWRTGSMITGANRYDGSIAEKTGWTTVSGHTYAIAAQRGERTLIVILLSSPGQTARRTDAAALFDYGFNLLRPVSIGTSEISIEGYTLDGVRKDLQATGDFNFLLDISLSRENIRIEYVPYFDIYNNRRVKAVFTLKSDIHTNIPRFLGEVELMYDISGMADNMIDDSESNTYFLSDNEDMQSNEDGKRRFPIVSVILIVVGVVVVFHTITYVRHTISVKKRRRNRQRRYGQESFTRTNGASIKGFTVSNRSHRRGRM